MDLEYDIFEEFPDGSAIWRAFARGLDEAQNKLDELSQQSANEFFIFHAPTKRTIARSNGRT
jgi:hypothetical protein